MPPPPPRPAAASAARARHCCFASLLLAGAAAAAEGSWQQALVQDRCGGGRLDDEDGLGQAQSLLQLAAERVELLAPPPQDDPLALAVLADMQEEGLGRNLASALTFASAEDTDAPPVAGDGAAPAAHVYTSMRAETRKVAIPLAAVCGGALVILMGFQTVGLIAIYGGAQAGMSLFMKLMFSDAVISRELDLIGIPAPFLVTAVQQLVAFFVIAPFWVTSTHWSSTGGGANNKSLNTPRRSEWGAILVFSFAFAANIGLNNASLSLISVSLNLIIRSCLPIVTLLTTSFLRRFVDVGDQGGDATRSEVGLMVAGVFCAGLATLASSKGAAHGASDSSAYAWGVIVCVLSAFAGALNLVVTRLMGANMKMNPVEAITYTSTPCAVFLMFPSFCLAHPTAWPGFSSVTDWQVLLKVAQLSPSTLGWIAFSGAFAGAYNLLQYLMVNYLTATHTAFCGNFNKAATIVLSLAIGLESLPGGIWSAVMLAAILGNILSFSAYSYVQVSA